MTTDMTAVTGALRMVFDKGVEATVLGAVDAARSALGDASNGMFCVPWSREEGVDPVVMVTVAGQVDSDGVVEFLEDALGRCSGIGVLRVQGVVHVWEPVMEERYRVTVDSSAPEMLVVETGEVFTDIGEDGQPVEDIVFADGSVWGDEAVELGE